MMKKKVVSVFSLVGLLFSAPSVTHSAVAQTPSQLLSLQDYSVNIGFIPPADNGAPSDGTTRSGATRSSDVCEGLAFTLDQGLGLTAEEQLALHLYLPKPQAGQPAVDRVVISLKTVDGSEHYEARVDVPTGEQIVKVDLPESLPVLEVGTEYIWSATLVCGGQLRPESPVLTGSVKRVTPLLTATQMEAVSLTERAAAYGESGLWYDWISTLAMLYEENPSDNRLVEMGQHLQVWADAQG